jgi:hypothetical protein
MHSLDDVLNGVCLSGASESAGDIGQPLGEEGQGGGRGEEAGGARGGERGEGKVRGGRGEGGGVG